MTTHQDGDLDDEDPIWRWDGMGQTCTCCGTAREGTASATVGHWIRCAGVVVYGRLAALGVDPFVAAVAARQLARELLAFGAVAEPTPLLNHEPIVLRKPTTVRTMLAERTAMAREVDPAFKETRRRMDATRSVAPFVHARAALRTEAPVVPKVVPR